MYVLQATTSVAGIRRCSSNYTRCNIKDMTDGRLIRRLVIPHRRLCAEQEGFQESTARGDDIQYEAGRYQVIWNGL